MKIWGFPHGKFIFAYGKPHEIPMETSKFHVCFWGVLAIAIHGFFSYGISGVHWQLLLISTTARWVEAFWICCANFHSDSLILVLVQYAFPFLCLQNHSLRCSIRKVPTFAGCTVFVALPRLNCGIFLVLYSKLRRTPMESKFRFIVATKRWLNPGSWMFLAVLTVFQWPKSHQFFDPWLCCLIWNPWSPRSKVRVTRGKSSNYGGWNSHDDSRHPLRWALEAIVVQRLVSFCWGANQWAFFMFFFPYFFMG